MAIDGADFYAFSGQKWLCGPEGTGGLFVRSDRMDRFTPAFVGGFGIKHAESYRPNEAEAFEFAPSAQRFEVGSVYRPGRTRRVLADGEQAILNSKVGG